uniref:DUF551 domain-containing protein n=1 Tax=viral metagenome TaxID=1070528 RepID=A0A6M3IHS6_9ZZZZ
MLNYNLSPTTGEVREFRDGRFNASREPTDYEKQLFEEIEKLKKENQELSNRLEKLVSQPSEPSFGQWIDVNDKLPKIEGDYLIFDTYGYINMQLYSIEKKFLDDDCLFTDDSVTHWMLLPQNPLPKP